MFRDFNSVPVVSLAAISTLSEVISEIPLPSLSGNENASSILTPQVKIESIQLLDAPSENLVYQLLQYLSRSEVDFLRIPDDLLSISTDLSLNNLTVLLNQQNQELFSYKLLESNCHEKSSPGHLKSFKFERSESQEWSDIKKHEEEYLKDDEGIEIAKEFHTISDSKKKRNIMEADEILFEKYCPSKVRRKLERKLVPCIPKLKFDEMNDSSSFQKFNRLMDVIFGSIEDIDLHDFDRNEDTFEIPQEILVPRYQLTELVNESAKLKSQNAMNSIGNDKLIKLLNILEINVRDGCRIFPSIYNENADERDHWLDLSQERVLRAADSCVIIMNVLTSKNMSKRVFIDDVIERVGIFLKNQMFSTLFPTFDPIYKELSKSKTGYVGSMKKKRSFNQNIKDKFCLCLYNKTHELISMIGDLVEMQPLTDAAILQLSSFAVAPFFVENIQEVQLACLKLVRNIFEKYDMHRKLLLDDILASIARLPSSKRSLRSYVLRDGQNIQMLTALVLQLIQSVVVLTEMAKKTKREFDDALLNNSLSDTETQIHLKYNIAMGTAHQFLTVFLSKCANKSEEIDYRPLFENFVQDLLATVNIPEWPAAELLLTLLGRILRQKFKDKSCEMLLRVSSLEYLGVIASRLRKDAVHSKCKLNHINSIIQVIIEEEKKTDATSIMNSLELFDKSGKVNESNRICLLKYVLLDYLAVTAGDDQVAVNARHFYICQWFRDLRLDARKNESENITHQKSTEESLPESQIQVLKEKQLLLQKVSPFLVSKNCNEEVLCTHIDDKTANLIVKYLSSKRPFFNSFSIYLSDILHVLAEQSTQIRTKALKCLTMIVAEDPEVLFLEDMQKGVQFSFLDSSTMVREAVVDLVGKFILHKEQLIHQYYDVITDRILDTGVSVRKRVIKILKEICQEYPHFSRIPDICVKIIRRINDEEGIKKLVMDVFYNLWFVPISKIESEESKALLKIRVENIINVVIACQDTGLEWFEQLLLSLFKPKDEKDEKKKTCSLEEIVEACGQIVDCLVEKILKAEEKKKHVNGENLNSKRIVACLSCLHLFAKAQPNLLLKHVYTLEPYLQFQCKSSNEVSIILNVTKTLELSVPLLKHPSQVFLSQLEEDCIKLILQYDKKVIAASISCLGTFINKISRNFLLIQDCFRKYFAQVKKFKSAYETDPNDWRLIEKANVATFRKAMYTISLLLRHFDFKSFDLSCTVSEIDNIVDEAFQMIAYFINHKNNEIQCDSIQAIGQICIRYHSFMLENSVKNSYNEILRSNSSAILKIRVLNNLEAFLLEEEIRLKEMDEKWSEYNKKENLKEMGDLSSGLASTVIQVFLKDILETFINSNIQVRYASLKVICQILSQGLVHPVQIVPYLICISTDPETRISHAADKELQEIEKKYPGFIHMKLLHGIKLSFRLQETIQDTKCVRGYRVSTKDEMPCSLFGFLYSIMKTTKTQRRAILTSLLKQFDETNSCSFHFLLFLADNLAYIPFSLLDEPLFVIHQIDVMLSIMGSNVVQNFKENLKLPEFYEEKLDIATGKKEFHYDDDLDEDYHSVLKRFPDEDYKVVPFLGSLRSCILLLAVKDHLKQSFSITVNKIEEYSPTDTSKAFDRNISRKHIFKFNPDIDISSVQTFSREAIVKEFIKLKVKMNQIDTEEDNFK